MTRTLTLLSLAAAAALAGCNKEDHTIVAGPGTDEPEANVAAANVVLPPSITASKKYRCKDNSLVAIDWLSDGTARIKGDQPGTGETVNPADAGSSVKGDPKSGTITYKGQTCKA